MFSSLFFIINQWPKCIILFDVINIITLKLNFQIIKFHIRTLFNYIDLLESLSIWLEKHMNECKQQIFISYLLTLAYVNYKPINIDNVLKVIMCLLYILLIMYNI